MREVKDTSRYGWMPTQILRPGVEHLACCNDHLSLDTLEGLYRTNFAKGTHRNQSRYDELNSVAGLSRSLKEEDQEAEGAAIIFEFFVILEY